jgi:hypothetical protein
MSCVNDVGSSAGRMGSGWRDVTDDRNGRCDHFGNDVAHAGGETAGCVQAEDNDLGVSRGRMSESILDVARCRRSDCAVKIGLAVFP